jgi:hypothetical protein
VDLEMTAAEWEAGLLPPERLPAVAIELMEAGYDSHHLRLVAGLVPAEMDEGHDLFARALAELDLPRTRTEDERGVALAAEYARRMLAGRVAPYEGARTVWQLGIDHFDNDTSRRVGNLDALVILADEWDQLPDQRPSIENDMRTEARKFLDALASQ